MRVPSSLSHIDEELKKNRVDGMDEVLANVTDKTTNKTKGGGAGADKTERGAGADKIDKAKRGAGAGAGASEKGEDTKGKDDKDGFDRGIGRGPRYSVEAEPVIISIYIFVFAIRSCCARFILLQSDNLGLAICIIIKDYIYMFVNYIYKFHPEFHVSLARWYSDERARETLARKTGYRSNSVHLKNFQNKVKKKRGTQTSIAASSKASFAPSKASSAPSKASSAPSSAPSSKGRKIVPNPNAPNPNISQGQGLGVSKGQGGQNQKDENKNQKDENSCKVKDNKYFHNVIDDVHDVIEVSANNQKNVSESKLEENYEQREMISVLGQNHLKMT